MSSGAQAARTASQRALAGASWMVLAGIAFALLNVATQWLTMRLSLASTAVAFWQYAFALALSLPLLRKLGLGAMRTSRPIYHLVRVALAALGVQAWVAGLAHVPIWQAIALVMTSPFFIIVGARLFLHEKVGAMRWLATSLGFAGVMIILQPWSDAFTTYSLLPIAAALLWGVASLMMKRLTHQERPETITVWLLLLLTPLNGLLALGTGGGLALPTGTAFALLLVAGVLTAAGQHFLTLAYSVADAAYVQPFDDLKLPLNVLAGWIFFGYAPSGYLWLGAALILSASLLMLTHELRQTKVAAK
ncbi:MAG: DMT family transporter [Candidatus Didemnitutus sp.]|nr:DMT family transporter [Candidatus Didemnitutus sp.]